MATMVSGVGIVTTKSVTRIAIRRYNKSVIYEWDEGKRDANRRKHRVDFSRVEGFDWDSAVIRPDLRKNYGEPRFVARGLIGGRLYTLVYTRRGAVTRVINLRKSNPREVKAYERHKA